MQAAVETVTVDDEHQPVLRRPSPPPRATTRTSWSVRRHAVPSASLLTSRAYAVVSGRDFVTPEDVKAVARPVLAHRITGQAGAVDEQRDRDFHGEPVLSTDPAPAALEVVRRP